jgi:septal ring factor EnvC (AmiA/AmiB activator)
MARACSRREESAGLKAGGYTCAIGLVVAFGLGLFGATVGAQNERARAEAQARRASERIRALQAEAERLAQQERSILNELRRLELDRQIKAEEVTRLNAEMASTQAELTAIGNDAARLERQVKAGAPVVGSRLSSLYKMGRPGYWRLLLDVDDVREVGRAYRTVSAMAEIDRNRVEEHRRKLEALRASRARLQDRRSTLKTLQSEASSARAALDRAIQTRNARVDSIDRQRDLNAQLTGELQDAQRRLQASIASLAVGRPVEVVALPIEAFRGDLPWPVPGTISVGFGRERDPRYGTSIIRNGVEIAAAEGRPVGAVHEGTVAFAGAFAGYGNLVIVQHATESGDAGLQDFSLYGHLETLSVQKGEAVERQRLVGTVGRTPRGKAALYFELRIDGRPVDPLQWLKR